MITKRTVLAQFGKNMLLKAPLDSGTSILVQRLWIFCATNQYVLFLLQILQD